MLLDNYKKQSPIVGVAGLGGGINSYIFLSSGGGGDYVISKSLRFNPGDTAFLNRNFSAGNRRKYTLSFWIKLNQTGTENTIFGHMVAGYQTQTQIRVEGTGRLEFGQFTGSWNFQKITTRLLRDLSAWYHIVYEVDTTLSTAEDRIKVYINGERETSFSTNTNPSQNLETLVNSNVEHGIGRVTPVQQAVGGNYYLADVHFIDGQALSSTDFGETDTAGVWQPKKYTGSYGTNGFHLDFKDSSSNAALGNDAAGSNNWTVNNLTALVSSTYGISFDGNDKVTFPGMALGTGDLTFECFFKMASGTSGFRRILSRTDGGSGNDMIIRVHTNGYMQWYFDNQEHTGSTTVTAGVWHHSAIVRSGSTISYYYDGTRIGTDTSSADMTLNAVILAWGHGSEYFTGEVYGARITKQALYTGASYTVPTSAITTTSQGASSSNVVHLSATTSTTTTNSGTTGNGTDSGDPTAVTAYPLGGPADIDSLLDSPSQSVADETDTGLGGQITGNYATLNPLDRQSTNGTLSNGNLDLAWATSSWAMFRSTIHVSSGKWYWEVTLGNNQYSIFGIIPTDYSMNTNSNYWIAQVPGAYCFYPYTGNKYDNTSSSSYASGDTSASGTVYGMALDLDAGTMTYYKDGVSMGTAFTGISGSFSPAAGLYNQSGNDSYNFGQRTFAHAAPSGYKALTVENLSDPTGPAAEPNKYFDTRSSLLAGGSNDRWTISDMNFSTDLSVSKSTSHDEYWVWTDSVRGFDKVLKSNEDDQEASGTAITNVSATGFTATNNWFSTGRTYATFNWDAGSSNTTIAAGGLNSSAYNQSQNWTSLISFNAGGWNGNGINPFNDNATDYDYGNTSRASGGYATLNISSLTGSRVISVTSEQTEVTITHDGGTTTFTPPNTSRLTHTFAAVTNPTSIKFDGLNSNSQFVLVGVSVDGERLVNSNITPTNVPTIASTLRASPESGFSIVTYSGGGSGSANSDSGMSFAHGLNSSPDFVIVKKRSGANGWPVYHSSTPLGALNINSLTSLDTGSYLFAQKHPSNSVVYLGNNPEINASGSTYVAYCFSQILGYSATGKYSGNGSDDGQFIFTGFRPRLIITKAYSSNSNNNNGWVVRDTSRDTFNEATQVIAFENDDPTLNNSHTGIDILSNGFKLKNDTNGQSNYNGWDYIYYAVAENPFKSARAR